MLTELQARALRDDELAERLRYHAEPGVQELAQRYLGSGMTELTETMRKLEEVHVELGDEQLKVEQLTELLAEILEECLLPPYLAKRIRAEI